MTFSVITSFHYKGREFKIVKDSDDWYCGINVKYLDEHNRTTKILSGYEMGTSQTIDECIGHLKNQIDIQELLASGINPMVATIMVQTGRTKEECESDEKLMEFVNQIECLL